MQDERATQLPPVEGLKKKRNAILSLHCVLYMFLGHHVGNLGQVWKMRLTWKGHTLSCSTAGYWHPWNDVGIAMSAMSCHVSRRSFAGITKEAKCCRVVLSLEHCFGPVPLGGKTRLGTILGRQERWQECSGRDGFKELLFPALQEGHTRSAQRADFKCLLCFLAVINMASKIKPAGKLLLTRAWLLTPEMLPDL